MKEGMRAFTLVGLLVIGCLSCCGSPENEQADPAAGMELPLPADRSRSFETAELQRPVLEELPLGGPLSLAFSLDTPFRAKGPAGDPDYATYGSRSVSMDLPVEDLTEYDRIAFRILPECDGARVVNLDFYMSCLPANHLISLENGKWNDCTLNIGNYARDKVQGLRFSATLRGRDLTTGDSCRFWIDSIRLQRTACPPSERGWKPDAPVLSTSGYAPNGPKTAILPEGYDGRFTLEDTRGKTVFRGTVREAESTLGRFGVADFSDFTREGEYILKAGSFASHPFRIADGIWDSSTRKALSFIFGQRCGHPVPSVHGRCHLDLLARHDGKAISFGGGWHDAGDLSQQSLQTGDVTYALLEAAERWKEKDPALAARLREEALWGLDFILRTRFGDGYRATSVGLLIWQDDRLDSFDDIQTVRVHNNAFDNYLQAGYEAYAARILTGDPGLQEFLTKTALADFSFAEEKFARDGFDKFIYPYEHSYNTSRSQWMATVSWTASQLYRLTGDERFAQKAADAIRYTLSCQETEGTMAGYFYRDTSRRSIVHYIHQSREQLYMQALTELCQTQPGHPERERWAQAVKLFGDYLKAIIPYTAPYGMLPSGVYLADEYQDTDNFYALHLFPPADAQERYTRQLELGEKLDDTHYLKRFPVWFNIFNGNNAVLLSMGKNAALCGRFLGDETLMDIAREQLYWVLGKNPFGQSMIYGEGWNYPDMDSFSSGMLTGMMPVGIRTFGDTDEPCWPQVNNACYKEVWVTVAGKYLSLVSEM